MRKRNILLLFLGIVLITIMITVLIVLSSKNSKLDYMSDDNRQLELVKELYTNIVPTINSGNINIVADVSTYRNFITCENYDNTIIKEIETLINSYSTEEEKYNYTIKFSFNIKELQLIVLVENTERLDTTKYIYNLSIDKKNNKISYELVEPIEHAIE